MKAHFNWSISFFFPLGSQISRRQDHPSAASKLRMAKLSIHHFAASQTPPPDSACFQPLEFRLPLLGLHGCFGDRSPSSFRSQPRKVPLAVQSTKPPNRQTTKPPNHQTTKPPNRQTAKPPNQTAKPPRRRELIGPLVSAPMVSHPPRGGSTSQACCFVHQEVIRTSFIFEDRLRRRAAFWLGRRRNSGRLVAQRLYEKRTIQGDPRKDEDNPQVKNDGYMFKQKSTVLYWWFELQGHSATHFDFGKTPKTPYGHQATAGWVRWGLL